jgi:hypothetical protein
MTCHDVALGTRSACYPFFHKTVFDYLQLFTHPPHPQHMQSHFYIFLSTIVFFKLSPIEYSSCVARKG